MTRLTLNAGRLHAEVDHTFGASLTDFSIDAPEGDRAPILRRSPGVLDAPARAGLFLLAPWTNRIAGARFRFAGREHPLLPNFPDGSAIHGDVCARPWRVTDRTPVSARLSFDSREHERVNFPWAFGCVARYELGPTALTIELSVTNLDTTPMPCGCGLHPYFMRGVLVEGTGAHLRAPVGGRYPSRAQVPTAAAVADGVCEALTSGGPVGDPGLDDCFAGFGRRVEIAWPGSGLRLTMDCSEAMSHLVVFTPRAGPEGPPLPWFCVEPVTMANDGFNLEQRGISAGVRVLQPGQTLNTTVTMHIGTEG